MPALHSVLDAICERGRLLQVSMAFSMVAILRVCFILVLSTMTTAAKASLGTKIFVFNLMVLGLVNAVLSFYPNIQSAFPLIVLEWWMGVLGDKRRPLPFI